MTRFYYVYLMTNPNHTVVYTGVTNDLRRRVWEHREKRLPGFTKQYNVTHLVYFEVFEDAWQAIEREKQLKAGSRKKKLDLVNARNPAWRDLYDEISREE